MKNFFKLFALLLVVALVSCSDDDSDKTPADDLENAKLSFEQNTPPVEVPQSMEQSEDENAQLAVNWIASANEMTTLISNLTPPDGAVKSNKPVGRKSSNGRTAGVEEDVLVYTWTHGDFSYAYQISQTSEKYIFELFWRFSPDAEFEKFLYAEEYKNERKGFLDWFSGNDSNAYVLRYQWEEDPDGTFYFDVLTFDNSFKISIVSNPDISGSVKYYLEGKIYYNVEWNSDGSGTWEAFDDNGNLTDSGSWQ